MRVPTDQQELERLVRRTRKALAAEAEGPQHVGPMARLAVASYPDFLTALSAECRAGTFPPYIESAVFTLTANMLLTLAHTAAGEDKDAIKEAAEAYLRTFINAFAEKLRLLCGATEEEAAHTVKTPAMTQ